MKTRVVTVAFFLAGVFLEMRNALPKNGLKGFPRGKLTVPWEHLPVLRGAAHRVNLKKQTTSNTEDMTGSNVRAYYVAKLFHGMASRSTNQRPFLKEFKVRFLCLLDLFLFGEMYSGTNRLFFLRTRVSGLGFSTSFMGVPSTGRKIGFTALLTRVKS